MSTVLSSRVWRFLSKALCLVSIYPWFLLGQTLPKIDKVADLPAYSYPISKSVDGFQKAPLLGGEICEFRGTSAAAPAITNLAAKILAVQSALTPLQVIDLIKRGGSRNEEGMLVATQGVHWRSQVNLKRSNSETDGWLNSGSPNPHLHLSFTSNPKLKLESVDPP